VWHISTAQRAIIAAGCLASAYTQLTTSPATIEFARALGGSPWQIGLLGALPTGTLFAQFLAAWLVNYLPQRRWVWFFSSLVQRLVFLPVALGPWIWPNCPNEVWLWGLICVTAINQVLLHFGNPLWLSWMGDYLPRNGLNRFWGQRQFYMQGTAAASLFLSAVLLLQVGLEIREAFALLIGLGTICGIADLLVFLRIEEPPVKPAPNLCLREILSAPFRLRGFRDFIRYSCFWNFAAMIGAPFISLYLLDHVGMGLYQVLLLWTFAWLGGASCSGWIGRLIEEHGHRPLLVVCTVFKSLLMLALLLIPRDPEWAFWALIPVFVADAILNAGILLANNGFLLKYSPCENRAMYLAAGTALAGIVGGATSVAAGCVLSLLQYQSVTIAGVSLVGYHLLFAISTVLRIVSIPLACRIHEPQACATRDFLRILMSHPSVLRLAPAPALALSQPEPQAPASSLVPASSRVPLGVSPVPRSSQPQPARAVA